MSALNFRREFAGAIRSGAKRQTVRPFRKDGRRPAKVGGALQLYTGMRTSRCEKVADAICTQCVVVVLDRGRIDFDGRQLTLSETRDFAQADGFESYGAMLRWFEKTYGHTYSDAYGEDDLFPFTGYAIRWELVA